MVELPDSSLEMMEVKMMRMLVVAAGMMLMMVQVACANEFEICQDGCGKKYEECVAKINSPNDIEVQDAKEVCASVKLDCDHYCDGRGDDPYREEKDKAAREKQEKEGGGSGEIRTLQFDN